MAGRTDIEPKIASQDGGRWTGFIAVAFAFSTLFFVSCTSMEESIDALLAVHEPYPGDVILVDRARYGMSMTYAPKVGEEEIDDPVDFCLDHIEEIADSEPESEMKKFNAVHALALVACRSPAVKVRISALRGIRILYENKLIDYEADEPVRDAAQFETYYKRMLEIYNNERIEDNPVETWQNEFLPMLRYFQDQRPSRFDPWWEVVFEIFTNAPVEEMEEGTLAAFEKAARLLTAQLALITAHIAQIDMDEQVRQEAIELFFLFPWETVRIYLPDWTEHLQSPPHRVSILMHILDKEDRPATVDVTIVSVVNKVLLRHISAGEQYHAVRLLQILTGMEEKKTDFWIQWCKQYLLENAGSQDTPETDPR